MTKPCLDCGEPVTLQHEAERPQWWIGRCACGVRNYYLIEDERVVTGQVELPLFDAAHGLKVSA